MDLGTVAVYPAVVGTRQYRAVYDFLCPAYAEHAVVDAAETALRLSADERQRVLDNGYRTVANYTAEKERKAFLEILANVKNAW